jgi:hypothetical protein
MYVPELDPDEELQDKIDLEQHLTDLGYITF